MMATLFSSATLVSTSVVGPGKVSARLNSSAFSVRQKYSLRKSSSMQTICAPRFAASRIFSTARARFSAAFLVERICIKPITNLSLIRDIVPRVGGCDRPSLGVTIRRRLSSGGPGMTPALYLLFTLGILGACDTLYYHEWRAHLPALGKSASAELQ